MIHEIILPMLGETMDVGQITAWRKAEGDKVTKGEPLFEVTTDKAAFEAECPADGYLRISSKHLHLDHLLGNQSDCSFLKEHLCSYGIRVFMESTILFIFLCRYYPNTFLLWDYCNFFFIL